MPDPEPGRTPPPPVVLKLAGWREPVQALAGFSRRRMPALLCSSTPPDQPSDAAGWSILCADPFEIVTWRLGQREDPFRLLEAAVAAHPIGGAPEGIPFAGGAVGYIGYDAGLAVEAIRRRARPALAGDPLPDMLFGLYSWAVVWDHRRRWWGVVATGLPGPAGAGGGSAARQAARIAAELESAQDAGPEDGATASGAPARILGSSVPRPAYLEMVARGRDLIAAGELYQVNLSQRLELEAPRIDAVSLFGSLTRHSGAPFSAYLDPGPARILSASPERFLSLRAGRAESRPIKGTAPRGATPGQDAELLRGLSESAKDRAENVMIVDLVRNDLSRVCRPHTVRARELFRVESYASVHHLVSVVEGEMDRSCSRADLLKAAFPPGSMTGAPKPRAMQAIEDLEPSRRGLYAGALGYLSFCGQIDLSVVIRTVILAGDRAWLQVGGGVVADSDPASEYEESLHKAGSLLRGMAFRREPGPGSSPGWGGR